MPRRSPITVACFDAIRATSDRMITLGELCDLVNGRVTLVIEIKSHFDGDRRLIKRAAEVLVGYRGPVALMSCVWPPK